MTDDVTNLVSALISKMERMDGDIDTLREENRLFKQALSEPGLLLKRAGFVRAGTPLAEDVWGDPLRGDRGEVIEKAAAAIDGAAMSMPQSNEEWHELDWDEIHAMASEAATVEGRRTE